MAFTGILDFLGARNNARAQAQQVAFSQALEQAKLAEQKRLDDAQLQASGVDPSTGKPLAPAALPAGLTQVNPHNKGQSSATPDADLYRHYLEVASYYAQQPGVQNSELAKFYQQQASGLGLGLDRLSTSQLNTAKIPVQQALAQQAVARSRYYDGILPERYQEAQLKVQQATIAGDARVHSAQIAADAAIKRAGISGNAQIEARTLAGYFALQGKSLDASVREAVAAATLADKYGQQFAGDNAAPTLQTPYNFAPPGGQAPTVNVNLGGMPALPQFDPNSGTWSYPQKAQPQSPPGAAGAPAAAGKERGAPQGGDAQQRVAKGVQIARSMLAQNKSPHDVRALLKEYLKGKPDAESIYKAVLQAAGIPDGSEKPQPLPIARPMPTPGPYHPVVQRTPNPLPVGGSQGAAPFP